MRLEALSFVLGLIVGSFLNVVIYRVPRGTFVSGGRRSHCPVCGAAIVWYDNLPVVSWVLLRGRARCCGGRISPRYPIIELLTAVAFLLVSLGRGPALFTDGAFDGTRAGILLLDLYLVAALIAASVIDIEHRILPDVINFTGIGVGLAAAIFVPALHAGCWLGGQVEGVGPEGVALMDALGGSATGAAVLWLIGFLGKAVYRTEAMGLGDVKLMAFAGTFVGPEGVLLALLVACVAGAVVGLLATIRTGDPLIPFGPFLAAGVLVARFAKDPAAGLVFVTWPRWLRDSPIGLPLLFGLSLVSLGVLYWLRRRRRDGRRGGDRAEKQDSVSSE